MKFGHFDDKNREYVITTPKTPYPWINYLGNEAFFSIMTNTSGGYSFYKDARLRRITRYRYNNVPLDDGGKYFYINDGGDVWNPGWKPVKKEIENYKCRHGMGYTVISGQRNNLAVEVTYFVPNGYNCEVQKITIKSLGDQSKKFKIFSFVEWCLWNAFDDNANFQRNFSTGEVEVDGSVIYHKTEYRERRNHYAFYSVNQPLVGFDTDRETFLGIYNGFHEAETVFKGEPKNSVAHGWSPVASHCVEIEIQPGETKELVFVLGYIENEDHEKWESHKVINKKKAKEIINHFSNVENVNKAFDQLRRYWDEKLGIYQINSQDDKLSRMVNIWNPYQCMITYLFSRSASFFESGIGRGMGFRDSNQDLVGFVHMSPERAKERILDIAATQKKDGSAYHQYQPLTKKGNNEIGGNFNDDPLWLILGVSAYIKESGDFSILDEMVPFDNDENNKATLFEHLRLSFYHVVERLGDHKLPLIGRADWNDCLNLNCFSTNPDESFQTTTNKTDGRAESVFIAGMFVLYGGEFIRICNLAGKEELISEAKKHVDEMKKSIDQHGWDGEWFIRAYDYFGKKIGSNECDEGKIFIESQGMCIMAGIGVEDGRANKALQAVKERLACEYGIVLNNPAFTKYYLEMGEISTYPEGYKENAGIFCHNNPWIMIAETEVGNGDQAFDYYKRITPAYLEEISDLHKTEPYVYSQMIAGKDAWKPGEAKNSWLTGTAAWNYYAISQYILGIKPEYDGLVVDPCIPKDWNGYKITRRFRGVTYNIEVDNPHHVSTGVKEMLIDGQRVDGNKAPVFEKGSTHTIKVTLG